MQLRSAPALGAAAAVLSCCAAIPSAASAATSGIPPAAGATAAGPRHGPARPGAPDRCGNRAATAFPLRSRLHGGPTGYRAGGARHTFALELVNRTAAACRGVHPLVVLVDRAEALTPSQIRLDYRYPDSGTWRPVDFETSDEHENIGLPGGEGGPGLTVPARGAVTVALRLGFTADARPGRVVVSATTMQRRGRGGAWVSESDHYAFDLRQGRAQLARTGRRTVPRVVLGALAGVLTAGGAVLLAVAGRLRRPPR